MQGTVQSKPTLAWPGLTREGALLLPGADPAVPPPAAARLSLSGRSFERKHEHHITVMNRSWGGAARHALGARRLQCLFGKHEWTLCGWGSLLLIHKPATAATGMPEDWSIVQLVELPAMQAFVDEVAAEAGLAPRQVVPHVTRYVSGSAAGIGLPDRQTLDERCLGELNPEALESLASSRGSASGP